MGNVVDYGLADVYRMSHR